MQTENRAKKFFTDQDGALLAEHALLLTLIAVACALAVGAFGGSVLSLFTSEALLGGLGGG